MRTLIFLITLSVSLAERRIQIYKEILTDLENLPSKLNIKPPANLSFTQCECHSQIMNHLKEELMRAKHVTTDEKEKALVETIKGNIDALPPHKEETCQLRRKRNIKNDFYLRHIREWLRRCIIKKTTRSVQNNHTSHP